MKFFRRLLASLRRRLRALLDRTAASLADSPSTPAWLPEAVQLWAVLHPRASQAEWVAFCRETVGLAYRDGFARGYAWQSRGWMPDGLEPEQLAELARLQGTLAERSPRLDYLLERGHDQADPWGLLSPEERDRMIELFRLRGRDLGIRIVYDSELAPGMTGRRR